MTDNRTIAEKALTSSGYTYTSESFIYHFFKKLKEVRKLRVTYFDDIFIMENKFKIERALKSKKRLFSTFEACLKDPIFLKKAQEEFHNFFLAKKAIT